MFDPFLPSLMFYNAHQLEMLRLVGLWHPAMFNLTAHTVYDANKVLKVLRGADIMSNLQKRGLDYLLPERHAVIM